MKYRARLHFDFGGYALQSRAWLLEKPQVIEATTLVDCMQKQTKLGRYILTLKC